MMRARTDSFENIRAKDIEAPIGGKIAMFFAVARYHATLRQDTAKWLRFGKNAQRLCCFDASCCRPGAHFRLCAGLMRPQAERTGRKETEGGRRSYGSDCFCAPHA
jgi:hypothetical protein